MNVGILIYDQVEVLDFSGPFEVFSTASRLSQPTGAFEVYLLSASPERVRARGGYFVLPHFDLGSHPELDVLIVPGGVHDQAMNDPTLIAWLKQVSPGCRIVASVCTGAFILATAGILEGMQVTTHWEDIADLRALSDSYKVIEDVRWVDQDHIVTSAGISAGIDMSLHLVARLTSESLALLTAKQMDFAWTRA